MTPDGGAQPIGAVDQESRHETEHDEVACVADLAELLDLLGIERPSALAERKP